MFIWKIPSKGAGVINDVDLVSTMVAEAPREISFMEKCGVVFAKQKGNFEIDYISGHSYPRHVRGENRTGSDFVRPLKRYAEKIGVQFRDQVFISRLFSLEGRIAGALGICRDGTLMVLEAGAIILATGGFGQVYLHTNNAAGITGDGHALAWNLGVPLRDMEFVQFYPTASGKLGNRLILFEIFVLKEGAKIKNRKGEDIVIKHGLDDPVKMTRDRLAQAIMQEILEDSRGAGAVYLDFEGIDEKIFEEQAALLPPAWRAEEKTLSVSPTTHFCMGGIIIDKTGETSLPGLFAAGETTGGIHAANRLGGNALCEVFTMGGIAGEKAAQKAMKTGVKRIPKEMIDHERNRLRSRFGRKETSLKPLFQSLKETMWLEVGILRNGEGLKRAMENIENVRSKLIENKVEKPLDLIRALELENMLQVSELVCRAALKRTESRGAHFRTDFPEQDDARWRGNIVLGDNEVNFI